MTNLDGVQLVAVTDSAANMLAGIRQAKMVDISLPCADHLLQLAIGDAVKASPELDEAITRCRELSSKVHQSTLANDRIRKEVLEQNSDPDTTTGT